MTETESMTYKGKWAVQVGKGKSAYKDRYIFDNEGQAHLWFQSINSHSGYKKRLVDPTGRVVARVITQ